MNLINLYYKKKKNIIKNLFILLKINKKLKN